MTEEQLLTLRDELKDYLNITWSEKDKSLKDIIIRGESFLNGKAGTEIDYTIDQEAKQLLLDYGRYVYNHSFELFEHNFFKELFSLSLREGVKDHAASETDTETSA